MNIAHINKKRVILSLLICLIAACRTTPVATTPPESSAPSTIAPLDTPTLTEVPATPTLTPIPPTPLPTETFTPSPTPTSPASIIELNGAVLPPGFSLIQYAALYRPTAFAFDAEGRLYVTSVDSNVYRLSDTDGDGRVDEQGVFATGFFTPLGITVHPTSGDVYISFQGGISIVRDTNQDGVADDYSSFVTGLPYGRHQNDNLKFGPDGWLYMGIGSTCDACFEADNRSATIMRFNIETKVGEVYATGMRNPYDIAFYPPTGEMFATDNGRDDLGLDAPSEELNHIVQGGNYGFPGCWNIHEQSGCEQMIPAIAFFEPHSSANGLDFYAGTRFPEEYWNNAFVSIFGSWLKPGLQTGIQRVITTPNGDTYTTETEWFLRFPAGVMPLPLLTSPDGALYVGDYINNVIYRISYGVP